MTRARALVIEDDLDLQNLMKGVLENCGFEVATASTGAQGLEATQRLSPDIITLDLNLPDTDGLILCRGLRRVTDAYILILTARSDRSQVLVGLESGADDYMTKPFSTLELSARISALLRRPRVIDPAAVASSDDSVAHGDLLMVPSQRTTELNGVQLSLTRVEYDLLVALARQPEQLVTRQQLLEQVWGTSWSDHHLVDVHVANLRRKLRPAGGDVEVLTVRGLGYRLHRVDTTEDAATAAASS